MTRLGQNVELYTGDDRTLNVTIYDVNGAALDVSTASAATYTVRDAPGGALLFAAKTLGAGITIATSVVSIVIASANTLAARGDRDYSHELELVLSGKKVTAMTGRFRLRKSMAGAGS